MPKRIALQYTTKSGRLRSPILQVHNIPDHLAAETQKRLLQKWSGPGKTQLIMSDQKVSTVGAFLNPKARANFDRIFKQGKFAPKKPGTSTQKKKKKGKN